MSEAFDPYQVWLGIPCAEQPPNYYRLLGLRRFESDAAAILQAGEARQRQLSALPAEPGAEERARLLAEISAAVACLSSPPKKAAYDQSLQAQYAHDASLDSAASLGITATGPNIKLLVIVGACALVMLLMLTAGAGITAWNLLRPRSVAMQPLHVERPMPPPVLPSTIPKQPIAPRPTPTSRPTFGSQLPPASPISNSSRSAIPTREHAPSPNFGGPRPYPPGAYPPGYPRPGGYPPLGGSPFGGDPNSRGPGGQRGMDPSSAAVPPAGAGTGKEVIQLLSNSKLEFREAGGPWYSDQPFTLEAWMQWNQAGNPQLAWIVPGSKIYQRFDPGRGAISLGYDFQGIEREGDVVPKIQEWHHWAIVSDGTKFNLFLDGERSLSADVPRGIHPKTPAIMGAPPLRLQAEGKVPTGAIAYIRDLRISHTARYTENFTPPDVLDVDIATFARPVLRGASGTNGGRLPDQAAQQRPIRLLENASIVNYVSQTIPTNGAQIANNKQITGSAEAASHGLDLQVEVGPAVNLLKDVPVSFPGGEAKIVDAQLTLTGEAPAKVEFDYVPPAQYLVDCAFVRTHHSDAFALQLVVEGRPCTLLIDWNSENGYYSGLERIRSSRVNSRFSPAGARGELLKQGKVSHLRCFVVKNHVVAELDGKILVNWKGDVAHLDRDASLAIPTPNKLGVCTLDSSYTVDSLRVYPIVKHRLDASSVVAKSAMRSPLVESPGRISVSNLQLQVTGWVDLLGDVEVIKHSGDYLKSTEGSTFYINERDKPQLEFIYDLPNEYVIEAQILRMNGQQPLILRFPVGERQVALNLDGFAEAGFRSGLEQVDGKTLLHSPFAASGPQLGIGRRRALRLVVLTNRVLLALDGQTVMDWTGDPAKLSLPKELQFGGSKTLGLTAASGFELSNLQLRPIAGSSLAFSATPTEMQVENLDLKLGLPVHLLREGNPRSRTRSVHWVGSAIATNSVGESSFEFSHPLPEDYILQGQIVRKSGSGLAAINVVVGGRACTFLIDGFADQGEPVSGLELIDGKRASDNLTSMRGKILNVDKPVELLLAVVKNRIIAAIDGRTLVDWRGDTKRLGTLYQAGGDHFLGITTLGSQFEFHGLRVAEITRSSTTSRLAGSSEAAEGELSGRSVTRHKTPDEAAQAEARTRLKEAFGEAIAKATKPDEKFKLAKEFVTVATAEKPAPRYVLLLAARKMAIAGQEFEYALAIVDRVAREYEVDALPLKLQTLQEAQAQPGLTAIVQEQLADAAQLVTTDAEANDRIDVLVPVAQIAFEAANKSKNLDKKKAFKAQRDRIVAEQQVWDQAQAALEALKTSPDDAEKNLLVGMYYGSQREDWPTALPYLIKGSNASWAGAAAKELAMTDDAETRLDAADAWFALIPTAKEAEQDALRVHTLELLEAAAPQLAGLNKAKAEKRMEDLKAALAAKQEADPGKSAARSKNRLRPGLMARVMAMNRTGAFAFGIARSSDDIEAAAGILQRTLSTGKSPVSWTTVATGYLQIDQDEEVVFTVENCLCQLDGMTMIDTRGTDRQRVELKLKRGRHPIVIAPSIIGIPGPKFHVRTTISRRNPLVHSPEEVEAELAKPQTVNGRRSPGHLIFGGANR